MDYGFSLSISELIAFASNIIRNPLAFPVVKSHNSRQNMSNLDVIRCSWAQKDPVDRAYHDEEWGVPVYDGLLLWENLMLEGFQAGLSWSIILKRREAFRNAFAGFDPVKVAAFTQDDVERLVQDPGIIRSRAKIVATIDGAKAFLDEEDFSKFAWSFVDGKPIRNETGVVPAKTPLSEEISAALRKKGFKFVGPVIVYAWMQAVGIVNDHSPDCFRRDACG